MPGKLAYLICSNIEIGGTLLARGLSDTRIAGRPTEEIDPDGIDQHPFAFDPQNISLTIDRATTPNGVCGITLHLCQSDGASEVSPNSVAALLTAKLTEQFDDVRYLWLRRRNKIAQSIARYRTSLDAAALDDAPTENDFNHIDKIFQVCIEEDRSWEHFFRQNSLKPLVLVYEEFIKSYQQTIEGVLEFIGQPLTSAMIKMPIADGGADANAIEWEQRYRVSRMNETVSGSAEKSLTSTVTPLEQERIRPASIPSTALSYVICTEPRTGSTLLADALAGTGIAGTPDEYFTFGQDDDYWLMRFGAESEADYIDKLVAQTSSPNGIFGVKLHWHQTRFMHTKLAAALHSNIANADAAPLELLLRTKLQSPRYVWLRRKNKVAQAISYYRASNTGVWRSIKGRQDQGNTPDLALPFDAA